jgi:DNA-binding LacI/PurR family transcriptional regulator
MSEGRSITSLDVAKRAGVSQSAVSRVFTPGASASAKTAEKVKAAAAELGYRPNVLARAMVSGKSRIIGLVVAYLDNYFYPEAMELLSNALQERGYHVLIFMATQTAGNIDDVVEEILDYQVDGIVAASVALSSNLSARCRAADVPIVLFNRRQDDSDMWSVTSDNFAGGRKAAQHLLECGYDRIGYIAGWEGASTQRDREAGFRAGLETANRTLHCRDVGNFRMDEAANAARRLLRQDEPPDAIFVANDHMAFAVMDVARSEFNLKVPEDLGIMGYDDVPVASWPAYDLTTIRQRARRMVSRTVDILLNEIEGYPGEPKQETICGPLIARRSTRIQKGE